MHNETQPTKPSVPMPETKEIPIDAYVVALDATKYYLIDEAHKQHIKKIVWVYIIDRASRTYCCEITPSYWLEYVYGYVVTQHGTDEEIAARMEDEYIMKPDMSDNSHYQHCYELEKLLDEASQGKTRNVYHYGETGVSFDDSTRDEQMEGLREHFQGNWVL